MPNIPFIDYGRRPQPQSNPYSINNAGDYGLSKFNPEETRRKQRQLYQQQIQQGMQNAQEQGLASGSFNPEASSYRATQGARNAMFGADVDLDKYAHEDQYKLMQSLLGIDQAKLGWGSLNEQKRQFDESQPSWLEGALDIGLGLAGSFLEDGGVVGDIPIYPHTIKHKRDWYEDGGTIHNSGHYLYKYGGYIPEHEANSPPTPNQPTNDNTLIKAKTGESIMNEHATSLFSPETINAINDTAKMAGKFFAGGGTIPKPVAPQDSLSEVGAVGGGGANYGGAPPAYGLGLTNTMGNGGGNMSWYNPNQNSMNNVGGLMGHAFQKIGGMFADGGIIGGDPDREAKIRELQQNIANINAQILTGKLKPTDIGMNGMSIGDYMSQMASQLYRLQTPTPTPAPSVPPPTPAPAGDANQNGIPDDQERTITIKTKPATNKSDNSKATGAYSGNGYSLPPR